MKTSKSIFLHAFVLALVLIIYDPGLMAQGVAVNENSDPPDATAIFDANSDDKGLLVPRLTRAQRDAIVNPATGLIIYQTTDTTGFYFYTGSSWEVTGCEAFSINDLLDGRTAGNSVFLGSGAGTIDDGTNNHNVAVGVNALHQNTTGVYNVAIGYQALISTTGDYNTAVGHNGLVCNTTGDKNTAVGLQALNYNTTGWSNTAIGSYALNYNTTGYSNTVSGGYANYYNQKGSRNTIIGFRAGYGSVLHSKSGNVLIGYEAGYNDTTDYKLYIENSNSSSPLIWGDFFNDSVRINGTLDINDAYTLPTVDGTNGQVLKTDGSGTLSWVDNLGATALQWPDTLNALSTDYDVSLKQDINDTSTVDATRYWVGQQGYLSTVAINDLTDGRTMGNSVFLGSGTGAVDDGNNYNTGLGYEALHANTSGEGNSSFGYKALHACSTGSYNTGLGREALYSDTTGGNNTALGYRALYSNTTGSDNVAIGYRSNFYNQEGSYNTIIGYDAGAATSLHDKSGNVFLGYQAGYYDTTDNKLYIENSSSSSPLIWGDFANDSVRINATLDINDAYTLPTIDGANGQVIKTDGSGALSWSGDVGATEINDLTDGRTVGNSVFLGSGTGAVDDGNNYNAGLGYEALHANTSGEGNSSFGYKALHSCSTGSYNTGFGREALYSDTTGGNNTVLGYRALYSNTTGSDNVAIGYRSNYYNQEGSYNTIIGYNAGAAGSTHSKSGNIFIGHEAGYNETGDSTLYIETGSSSSPLIYGEFNNDLLLVNGEMELANGTSPSVLRFYEPSGSGSNFTEFQSQAQSANVIYTLPDTDGSTDQILQTDGSGVMSWTDDIGATEINDLSDGKTGVNSVFIGAGAGEGENGTGNYNVAVGVDALKENTYGNYNTANGSYALSDQIDGDFNSAYGHKALESNYTGSKNTAIGAEAMISNCTGTWNTAIGCWSLYHNSGGDYNVAVGQNALFMNVAGSSNVACGFGANHHNNGGSFNTIIGHQAGSGTGYHNKSGNVFLGYQAGYYETSDNKLYIENSNSSSPLIGGDFSTNKVTINDVLKLAPRSSSPSTPSEGELYVNSSDHNIYCYLNGSWQQLNN